MRAPGTAPIIPGLEAPPRRILLASLARQKRLRAVHGGQDLERWVRAYARRWFVVEAPSADAARTAVERYLTACGTDLNRRVDSKRYGIVEAGHNAPGGPDRFPRRESGPGRPVPSSAVHRRARARAPTPRRALHALTR